MKPVEADNFPTEKDIMYNAIIRSLVFVHMSALKKSRFIVELLRHLHVIFNEEGVFGAGQSNGAV